MTDHLPECPKNWSVPGDCACDLLRACEQRVREDERTSDYTGISAAMHTERMRENYERGLGAARDAVAASSDHYELCICDECCGTAAALAAIDALKEDK